MLSSLKETLRKRPLWRYCCCCIFCPPLPPPLPRWFCPTVGGSGAGASCSSAEARVKLWDHFAALLWSEYEWIIRISILPVEGKSGKRRDSSFTPPSCRLLRLPTVGTDGGNDAGPDGMMNFMLPPPPPKPGARDDATLIIKEGGGRAGRFCCAPSVNSSLHR